MANETERPPVNNPGGERLRFTPSYEWPTEKDNRQAAEQLGRAVIPTSMEDTVELPVVVPEDPQAESSGHLPEFRPLVQPGAAPANMPVWTRREYNPNRHQEQELPVAPPPPESPPWAGPDHARLEWPSAHEAPGDADRT